MLWFPYSRSGLSQVHDVRMHSQQLEKVKCQFDISLLFSLNSVSMWYDFGAFVIYRLPLPLSTSQCDKTLNALLSA